MSERLLYDRLCGIGGVVLHTWLLSSPLAALTSLASAISGWVDLPSESEEPSFRRPDGMHDRHVNELRHFTCHVPGVHLQITQA
jgi:hypothetical protein